MVETERIIAQVGGSTPKTNINVLNYKLGWQFPSVHLDTKHSHLIPQLFPVGPPQVALRSELAPWQPGKQSLRKILQG